MTDRILDESGMYVQPTAPQAPDTPSAEGLPEVKADPYANVDTTDFSTADRLTKKQKITLAEIAGFRGESDIAMRWKMLAVADDTRQARQTDAETMEKILHPKHAPMGSGPIVSPKDPEPWASDPTYVQASRAVAKAQAKAEATRDGTSQRLEANAGVLAAKGELEDVVAGLAQATGWTETEQRSLEARRSLQAKSAEMFEKFGTAR